MQNIELTSRRVPPGLDKLSMMQEYDVPDDLEEAQQLLTSLTQKYNDVMRCVRLLGIHVIHDMGAWLE